MGALNNPSAGLMATKGSAAIPVEVPGKLNCAAEAAGLSTWKFCQLRTQPKRNVFVSVGEISVVNCPEATTLRIGALLGLDGVPLRMLICPILLAIERQ